MVKYTKLSDSGIQSLNLEVKEQLVPFTCSKVYIEENVLEK
jgi:hypothetical protein